MAGYDIEGARQAGVSDADIAASLAPKLNYDLEGARKAGVPDAEIASALAGKFNSTPGGAAVGNPGMTTQFEKQRLGGPLSNPYEMIGKIGGSGATGAVLGAASPEILRGLGAAASSYPQTRPIGPFINTAGSFLSGLGTSLQGVRGKAALTGGISGVGSELAGQTSEAMGAGPVTAEAARFVGGGGVGFTTDIAMYGLKKWALTPALSIWSKFRKEGLKALLTKMDDAPQSLSEQERAYLGTLSEELRAGQKSGKPMEEVYEGLAESAGKHIAMGEADARKLLSEAEFDSQKAMSQAMSGRMDDLRAGRARLGEIGETAIKTAQNQRLTISGADKELTDIGTPLRETITTRHGAAVAEKGRVYKVNEAARDALVKENEAAGNFADSMPEYQAIVSSLKDEMKPGKHSKAVADDFAHILTQMSTKAKSAEQPFGGMGADDPFLAMGEKKPPVTFQQIDDVRRQLGEVFKGNPPEGFKAIGADTARKYYGALRNLQIKYAGGEGGAHAKLLSDYESGIEGLRIFQSRTGKKFTALDKYNPEEFATDSAALPRTYFKTKEGVESLLNLTGDRGQVVQAGKEYATNQLRGKTGDQVKAWQQSNSDWLKALPEVNFSVGKYGATLDRGERIARNTKLGAERVAAQETQRITDADVFARELKTSAERAGGQATQREGAIADALTGKDFPIPRVRNLIESGDRVAWEIAGPAIAASPKAKAAMSQAVRQVLADVQPTTKQGARSLKTMWDERLSVALEKSQLLPQSELAAISQKVNQIAEMKVPEAQRIGYMKVALLSAVGGHAASLGARGAYGGVSALADLIPQ